MLYLAEWQEPEQPSQPQSQPQELPPFFFFLTIEPMMSATITIKTRLMMIVERFAMIHSMIVYLLK